MLSLNLFHDLKISIGKQPLQWKVIKTFDVTVSSFASWQLAVVSVGIVDSLSVLTVDSSQCWQLAVSAVGSIDSWQYSTFQFEYFHIINFEHCIYQTVTTTNKDIKEQIKTDQNLCPQIKTTVFSII